MPVYVRQLSVPAGTPRDSPVTEAVEVKEQYVKRALRFAPPGSNAQVNVELRSGEDRLLPEEGEEAVILPATTEPEPVETRLPGEPNTLEWRAWSPNASFEHTLTLKVVTKELARARPVERLLQRFGQVGRVTRTPTLPGQDLTGVGEEQ